MKLKSMLLTVLAFTGVCAAAGERDLVCETDAPFSTESKPVETRFRIFNPLTESPESDLNGLLDVTHDELGLATYSFSNECDNMYEIVFFTKDLVSALGGHMTGTTALFRYSYSEPGFKDVVTVARCRAQ